MNLYTLKEKNVRKTWLLMAGFAALVLSVAWLFATYLQQAWILYAAMTFALFMNVGAFWFSDKLALAQAGARLIAKEDAPELYRLIENLALAAGMPMPKVYIIDDPAPNAFATGRDPQHAAVAVTTGLLSLLERSELEGVLAHELSHIQNRDTLVMTVATVLVGFLAMLADLFFRVSFFGTHRDNERANALTFILFLAALFIAPIAGQLMQLAISRKREYLADASGALLTRYPEGLARALEKIAAFDQPLRRANYRTAPLYIANPFGAHPKGLLSRLSLYFSTHPPIEKRIAALRGMRIKGE